ncbi:MAG: hypothetical protein KBD37_05130 [Burkholderiales bacterium]|nr:hypothetical protein [Burkholderiales bacterium]
MALSSMIILRLYPLLSFIAQACRIPVAFIVVKDSNFLNIYLIVISMTIPASYLASEVFQYRYIDLLSLKLSDKISCGILLITILYVLINYGGIVALFYSLYIIALLASSIAAYNIRINLGVKYFLVADMVLNMCLTLFVIMVSLTINNFKLSYALLIVYIGVYLVYTLVAIAKIYLQRMSTSQQVCPKAIAASKAQLHGGDKVPVHDYIAFVQMLLMLTTQLERAVIGTIYPLFLGFISIAASIHQGWRRLVLDDAILVDRIFKSQKSLVDIVVNSFNLYFLCSVPVIVICGGIIWGLKLLPLEINKFNIFYSLNVLTVKNILALAIIYFAALPSSIVSINLIRTHTYTPRKWLIVILLLIQLLLLFMLALCYTVKHDIPQLPYYVQQLVEFFAQVMTSLNIIWAILFVTVGINIVLLNDFIFSAFDDKEKRRRVFMKSCGWYFVCYSVCLGVLL